MGALNDILVQALARERLSEGIGLKILISKNLCSRDVKDVRKSSEKEPLVNSKSPIVRNPRSIISFLYIDLLCTQINLWFQIISFRTS